MVRDKDVMTTSSLEEKEKSVMRSQKNTTHFIIDVANPIWTVLKKGNTQSAIL